MKTAEIYAELTEIFRRLFGDETMVLRPDMTAFDVEGWDSFRHVAILLATQERFGFKLSNRDIDRLNCVGDLADLIERRQERTPQ